VNRFSLTHLSNDVLRHGLSHKAAREKEVTAELLAHIAEFDHRRLFLPAAYPSMLDYCIGELRLSEDAAKKRLKVARAGRECPGVFEALASGRVHLSGLVVLATHLSPENAPELLAAAAHRRREEIERLVAERFPKLDVPAQVTPMPDTASVGEQGSPGNPDGHEMTAMGAESGAPGHPNVHARVSPLSAEAFAVQFTRSREADERFRRAQDLLGHQVASNDIAEVYDRAVRELIKRLEKARFAACEKPRNNGRGTRSGSRHISNEVQREGAASAGLSQGSVPHRRGALPGHGGGAARGPREARAVMVRRTDQPQGGAGRACRRAGLNPAYKVNGLSRVWHSTRPRESWRPRGRRAREPRAA